MVHLAGITLLYMNHICGQRKVLGVDSSGSFSIKKPELGLTYLVFFFQALGAKDKSLQPVEARDV